MKCALCHARKGKRGCKVASAQLICPSCCASSRRDECAGCDFYETSQAFQREKQIRNRTFTAEIIPDVDDRCDEALTLVERGDIVKGEAMLEALRAQYPSYHTVLYGVGVCHGLRGQTNEAIACLERAVEIFPLLAHAHYNLGSAYCQKLDVEKAVRAYQTAIEVDGEDGQVGRLARGHLDKLETAVRRSGLDLPTYINNKRVFDRAFEALHEKRFQAAIDLFEQVLATEKGHVQSYGNMGLAYAGLGNRQKALECLNKAIELDPEYEPAMINRIAVERLRDGEAMADQVFNEVDYYSEFKLPGRSYVRELAERLEPTGRELSSHAQSEE
jgi:tetratricopeptide (TPR) repeat protein